MRLSRGRIVRPAPGNPFAIDRSIGRVYGALGYDLLYSDDGWATARRLASLGRNITAIHVTAAGTIICGTDYPGRVFRVLRSGKVSQVLALPVGYCEQWSINGAGTKVVVGEYGLKTASDPVNNARRVYYSADDGQSWTEIFAIPALPNVHVHAVGIDPYTGQVWVSHGDDTHAIYRLDPPSWAPVQISSVQQPTSIITQHPDYILFGSDYGEIPNGIFRYTKSSGNLERVLSLPGDYDQPFMAAGYDQTTETAYFGTSYNSTANPKVSLWAAKPPFTNWSIVDEIDTRTSGLRRYKSVIPFGNSILVGVADASGRWIGHIVHQLPMLRRRV